MTDSPLQQYTAWKYIKRVIRLFRTPSTKIRVHIPTFKSPHGLQAVFQLLENHPRYKEYPALAKNRFFVASFIDKSRVFPRIFSNYLPPPPLPNYSNTEVFLFPCDSNGNITDWSELPGSEDHATNIFSTLRNANYKIIQDPT